MSEMSSHTETRMGSERSFGIVFAIVFTIIAFFPMLGDGNPFWWSLAIASVFLALGLIRPSTLRPLNVVWFKFGLLLNRIISPIVIGLLFFVTVVPTGLIIRLMGGDLLKKKLDPNAQTYWIPVDKENAPQSSMRKQF